MKYYLLLLATVFKLQTSFSQVYADPLKVLSITAIKGNYLLQVTDSEGKFNDTITLVSFAEPVMISGQVQNELIPGYGNLTAIRPGHTYYFNLFKPVILQRENDFTFFCLPGIDTIWTGRDSSRVLYGIANSIGDTVQYLNPLMAIIDRVPSLDIIQAPAPVKELNVPSPISLRQKVEWMFDTVPVNPLLYLQGKLVSFAAQTKEQRMVDSLRRVIIADTSKFNLKDITTYYGKKVNAKNYAPLMVINGKYYYRLDIIEGKQVMEFVNEFMQADLVKQVIIFDSAEGAAVFGSIALPGAVAIMLRKKVKFNPFVAGFKGSKKKGGNNYSH